MQPAPIRFPGLRYTICQLANRRQSKLSPFRTEDLVLYLCESKQIMTMSGIDFTFAMTTRDKTTTFRYNANSSSMVLSSQIYVVQAVIYKMDECVVCLVVRPITVQVKKNLFNILFIVTKHGYESIMLQYEYKELINDGDKVLQYPVLIRYNVVPQEYDANSESKMIGDYQNIVRNGNTVSIDYPNTDEPKHRLTESVPLSTFYFNGHFEHVKLG
ncbi:hypothetical protein ANN_08578 [Periplaneta americana]|uniref:Uncharacterized protein n=1 Tax=Periplaneta americana TaxID=6978 RepID=A0ABQ8T3B7_PERAM|nr:hypothetical protein ANN_08578 [Periplaneta americana]